MFVVRTPLSKNQIWRRKNRKYAIRLLSFVAHIISHHSSRTHNNKTPTAAPCFRGPAVQRFVDDVTGSRTISAHRTARNKIPTHRPTSIFSMSTGSTTPAWHFLVRWYRSVPRIPTRTRKYQTFISYAMSRSLAICTFINYCLFVYIACVPCRH